MSWYPAPSMVSFVLVQYQHQSSHINPTCKIVSRNTKPIHYKTYPVSFCLTIPPSSPVCLPYTSSAHLTQSHNQTHRLSPFHDQPIQLIKLAHNRLPLHNLQLPQPFLYQLLHLSLISLMLAFAECVARPPPRVGAEVVVREL